MSYSSEPTSVRSLAAGRHLPAPRGLGACAQSGTRPIPLAAQDPNALRPAMSVATNAACMAPTTTSASRDSSSTRHVVTNSRVSFPASPQADRRHDDDPHYVAEYMKDIMDALYRAEQRVPRDAYLSMQPELSEKMRTILVDWLVEVHMKFKCRPETLYLAVDIVDRYLATTRTTRSTLQLVGVTSMLIAAKYEEIWAPEVKDCVYISANTYTRDEILKMERSICVALQFRLTLPTPMNFIARLLDVADADTAVQHTAFFFAETSMLNYSLRQMRPSVVGAACVFLARLTQRCPDVWTPALQHYSRYRHGEVVDTARRLLEVAHSVAGSKYTAVKRKYSSSKFGAVGTVELPPVEALDM